jgi:hypothetical protein
MGEVEPSGCAAFNFEWTRPSRCTLTASSQLARPGKLYPGVARAGPDLAPAASLAATTVLRILSLPRMKHESCQIGLFKVNSNISCKLLSLHRIFAVFQSRAGRRTEAKNRKISLPQRSFYSRTAICRSTFRMYSLLAAPSRSTYGCICLTEWVAERNRVQHERCNSEHSEAVQFAA